jgi:hypothetical protein
MIIETLDMLWPQEKKLPEPYWWGDVPRESKEQSETTRK